MEISFLIISRITLYSALFYLLSQVHMNLVYALALIVGDQLFTFSQKMIKMLMLIRSMKQMGYRVDNKNGVTVASKEDKND